MEDLNISVLTGKVITSINKVVYPRESDIGELHFVCSDGTKYRMYHDQSCCEHVYLEDIAGDLDDLIGEPILSAYESTNNKDTFGSLKIYDSFTWTFYHLATIKGYVTLRWLGQSNGYYSESMSIEQIKDISNED